MFYSIHTPCLWPQQFYCLCDFCSGTVFSFKTYSPELANSHQYMKAVLSTLFVQGYLYTTYDIIKIASMVTWISVNIAIRCWIQQSTNSHATTFHAWVSHNNSLKWSLTLFIQVFRLWERNWWEGVGNIYGRQMWVHRQYFMVRGRVLIKFIVYWNLVHNYYWLAGRTAFDNEIICW